MVLNHFTQTAAAHWVLPLAGTILWGHEVKVPIVQQSEGLFNQQVFSNLQVVLITST